MERSSAELAATCTLAKLGIASREVLLEKAGREWGVSEEEVSKAVDKLESLKAVRVNELGYYILTDEAVPIIIQELSKAEKYYLVIDGRRARWFTRPAGCPELNMPKTYEPIVQLFEFNRFKLPKWEPSYRIDISSECSRLCELASLITYDHYRRGVEAAWTIYNPGLDFVWQGVSLSTFFEALYSRSERYKDVDRYHHNETFWLSFLDGEDVIVFAYGFARVGSDEVYLDGGSLYLEGIPLPNFPIQKYLDMFRGFSKYAYPAILKVEEVLGRITLEPETLNQRILVYERNRVEDNVVSVFDEELNCLIALKGIYSGDLEKAVYTVENITKFNNAVKAVGDWRWAGED